MIDEPRRPPVAVGGPGSREGGAEDLRAGRPEAYEPVGR